MLPRKQRCRRPVINTGRRHVLRLGLTLATAALALVGSWSLSPFALAGTGATGPTGPTGATGTTTAVKATSTPDASATATVGLVFKSVTISSSQLTYRKCSGGYSTGAKLGFPNGKCTTQQVKVTNGGAPSTVLITGSNAVPSDHGKRWALCGGKGGPSCAIHTPGVNQFSEQDGSVHLGLTGACDLNFAATPCGSAKPHQAHTESLSLYGPKASTDQSPTFTTVITWTAN